MKTSLGIWAFGPMVNRFVPAGYQPQHSYDSEPVVEKVHRAVEGLGDLIDGYEFHYPNEISHDNLDEVRAALGPDHDIYCVAGGLHLDPRFGRGGLVNPDASLRAEAQQILRDAAEFAGSLGAHLIVDANKGGRFVKTAPGTFDVREINPRGAAKRPTPKAK